MLKAMRSHNFLRGILASVSTGSLVIAVLSPSPLKAEDTDPRQESPARNEAARPDGSLQTHSLLLPFSSLASEEAKAVWLRQLEAPNAFGPDIGAMRKMADDEAKRLLALANSRYQVTSQRSQLDGIPVETFLPTEGVSAANRHRVLIELHGGGFMVGGGGSMGAAESVPIASIGRIRVIAVDYRQAPEHLFPAASEDVERVYRNLLKTYRPENIGIYGCSAGGMLAAQSVAWFVKKELPIPGAIGIFCASAHPFAAGDSGRFWPGLITGGEAMPPNRNTLPYFAKTDPDDPLVMPSASKEVLRKFPPTLFVTGTRSTEMSGAAQSHLDLLDAGVSSQLLLFDGLSHGFVVDSSLPESRRAYDLIVRFFMQNLGRRTPTPPK